MRNALIGGMLSLGVLLGTTVAPALAQPAGGTVPSYAHPSAPSGEETIRGRIDAIPGKYQVEVRDDRGYIDNVALHDGTIINPTGITLAPGMRVTIYGTARGHEFVANQIDTPYHQSYAYAYPVYPYPYYAYPGPYWWGPRYSFRFGWR